MSARKHGQSGRNRTRTYTIWWAMRQRCSNKNNSRYIYYDGRGIRVCNRWQGEHGYENFLADMGAAPPERSLDRIDPYGDYRPQNCRWATITEQSRNKRSNIRLSLNDRTMTVAEWARELNVPARRLYERHKLGWDSKKILTMPVRTRQN